MTTAQMNLTPAKALLFIPGSLFWALVIAGAVTENGTMIGIAVAMAAVVAVAVITVKVRESGAAKVERQRIWRTGRATTARVVSIGTNGGSLNDHPYVDLQLDVTAEDDTTYRASVRALISQLAIPRIQPGCDITVRVDPANKNTLLVDPALTPYGYE